MTLQEIKVNAVVPITGGLSSLTTTDKSNLVNAVNEVNLKAGSGGTPVSIASVAEINTGTDNSKATSPLGLAGSKYLTQDNSKLFAISTNVGNAYSITLVPAIASYTAGMRVYVKINASNSGAATLSVNGLAAINLYREQANPIQSQDFVPGRVYLFVYDGVNFQIVNFQTNTFPTVTSGERVITVTSAGPQKNYDIQDQIVSSSPLTSADWSSVVASVAGLPGQLSYDANYRYDCVGTNQWRRSALNGNLIDLYLSDIDDSAGAKTSSQLNTAYPNSLVGQRVWGTQYLYEKKTSLIWKKLSIADA